ncbi:MAG: hypothetical protein HY869_04635 [Chloroflexi bacterium]|nr:hypothetical protein [Chloroflexota bacterium]
MSPEKELPKPEKSDPPQKEADVSKKGLSLGGDIMTDAPPPQPKPKENNE